MTTLAETPPSTRRRAFVAGCALGLVLIGSALVAAARRPPPRPARAVAAQVATSAPVTAQVATSASAPAPAPEVSPTAPRPVAEVARPVVRRRARLATSRRDDAPAAPPRDERDRGPNRAPIVE